MIGGKGAGYGLELGSWVPSSGRHILTDTHPNSAPWALFTVTVYASLIGVRVGVGGWIEGSGLFVGVFLVVCWRSRDRVWVRGAGGGWGLELRVGAEGWG